TRKKITVTGLSSANHTVVITPGAVDGTHPLYIFGVAFRNTTGVAVHNLGIGGGSVSGGNLGLTPPYSPLAIALTIAPQLTLIEIGTNDASPLAGSFTTTMQTAITNLLNGG